MYVRVHESVYFRDEDASFQPIVYLIVKVIENENPVRVATRTERALNFRT